MRPLEASSGGLPTLWMEFRPIPLWPPGRPAPFSRICCEAADRVGSQQHVSAHHGEKYGLVRHCIVVCGSNFAGGRLKLRIFCICKKSWMPRVVGNLSHEMAATPPPPSNFGSQNRYFGSVRPRKACTAGMAGGRGLHESRWWARC